LKRVSWGLRQ